MKQWNLYKLVHIYVYETILRIERYKVKNKF